MSTDYTPAKDRLLKKMAEWYASGMDSEFLVLRDAYRALLAERGKDG